MPKLGWDVDPVAAGSCGIIFPIGFALCGWFWGRRFKHWLAEPKTLGVAALIYGALSSVNFFLLFYLLIVEN